MHLVKYKCQLCNKEFDAPQGSRRYLCPGCLVKKVTGKKKKKGEK